MRESHAEIGTQSASKYLQQLCRHWAHKFGTEFDTSQGRIVLPLGVVRLRANAETLFIDVEAGQAEDLGKLRGAVQSPLERFAHREALIIEWRDPPRS